MKLRLNRFGRIFFGALVAFTIVTLAQQKDAPKLPPDKLAVGLDLQKRSLQNYISLEQIQNRYNEQMRRDPDYQRLQKESDELGQKFNQWFTDAQKLCGDPKQLYLNPNTLECESVKTQTPQPTAPPAAEKKP